MTESHGRRVEFVVATAANQNIAERRAFDKVVSGEESGQSIRKVMTENVIRDFLE